ncbi:RNA-binding (RRM/RBD/RNP motifs) family protein [Actinidia rufa]|uniref:RNA-binding (RRM/RBD/RNP motifs) family protein n=1 Tax=Actinidia rufa TaxID=165716 RepID=A0A7J0D9T0_9ERIC|nr:RNA-binding (RRM/RBD/RNP motifs) family protein [Actinidia rufa]
MQTDLGRARGFGFVVFADPAVAERVIMEKHNIDEGSPCPGRTRKIFVGGLPSTITESDFKKYFEQFGTITDVVVMYDHNTQRPRGFGFITYDSEDAVDKVLFKTFHELNGKLVEVKRAVPKELSPSPSRSPFGGYNYGFKFSPIPGSRSGFAPYGSGYGMGLNFEPGLNPNFGGNANFNSTLSYGRGLNPYYYIAQGIGICGGMEGLNYETNSANSNAYVRSESGSIGGTLANTGVNWSFLQFHPKVELMFLAMVGILVTEVVIAPIVWEWEVMQEILQVVGPPHYRMLHQMVVMMGLLQIFVAVSSVYGDPTWRSTNSEREEGSGSLGYGLGNGASDILGKSSPRYVGGYSVVERQTNTGKGQSLITTS